MEENQIKTVDLSPESPKTHDRSEKMGTMSIGKLIATMSLPAIFSMLVQALYNIVDSYYVAKIQGFGTAPTDAVSIAFPFQMLVMAFALGIGVGSNSLIARFLGQGDKYSAAKVASTGLVVSLIHCAIFMILGATVARPILGLFTDDPQTLDFAVKYLSTCVIWSAFLYVEIFVNKVNQAMSRMTVPMIAQLLGAIINIILDPIFINNFELGVKGAAVATVIGQFCAMTFTVIMYFVSKSEVSISLKYVRMKGKTILNIYKIGLPTIILNAVSSFTVMIMNFIMHSFGYPNGVTILGIYFKVQSFVFMPCFGLNQVILPIMAYNYGANKKSRFVKTYRLSLIIALTIMIIGTVLFLTMSDKIIGLFENVAADKALMQEMITAFKTICLCFIPAAIGIISITMFQSIGYGVRSMIMSILRQLVILIPVALIFCALGRKEQLWWAYPIAELSVVAIFFPIALKTINKVFKKKEQAVSPSVNN